MTNPSSISLFYDSFGVAKNPAVVLIPGLGTIISAGLRRFANKLQMQAFMLYVLITVIQDCLPTSNIFHQSF